MRSFESTWRVIKILTTFIIQIQHYTRLLYGVLHVFLGQPSSHIFCYTQTCCTGGRYRRPNIAEFAEKTYAISRFVAKILPAKHLLTINPCTKTVPIGTEWSFSAPVLIVNYHFEPVFQTMNE